MVQASNFLMRMAECKEVVPEPKSTTASSTEDVSVATTVSPFIPTRRRLVMVQDP